MNESGYQSKIIKSIEAIGGTAINGNFTIAGTADLICGYPIWYYHESFGKDMLALFHLHVEVKTKYDYERVMRSVYEKDGYYCFREDTKSLKAHEFLQITKLNGSSRWAV